jgi:hypothetical protein
MAVLSDGGEWKPRTAYWERRVLFGDCLADSLPNKPDEKDNIVIVEVVVQPSTEESPRPKVEPFVKKPRVTKNME